MANPMLHIQDISQDGTTGHVTLHAYVVEMDGETEMRGPLETHGIDPLALHSLYGDAEGCVDKWLASVKGKMVERHMIRKNLHADLHHRIGKRL